MEEEPTQESRPGSEGFPDEGDVRFSFSRSGGPGGQNVNKVSTRVTAWFDVEACSALTAEQKRRIQTRLSSRISGAGVLRVTSSAARSQAANRESALMRLRELVRWALSEDPRRIPTRVPRRAKQERRAEKAIQSARKRQRGQVRGEE